MAKKADPAEKPFQPVETALLRSVLDDNRPAVAVPPPRRILTDSPVVIMKRPPESPLGESTPKETVRVSHPEKPNRPIKVHLSPGERTEFNRVLNSLSQELGTGVSASHIQRALIAIFRHAEDEILKRAREHTPLKRPPNDDLTAIAAFEFRLSKLLSGAFREAPPMRE